MTRDDNSPGSRRRRWSTPLAAVAASLTVPVATWWLIGDQTAEVPPGTQLDYLVRPMEIAPAVETGVGGGCAAAAVVAFGHLLRATRHKRLDRRWWATLGPVLVAGVIVGASWRAITLGTVGANIGAGLAIVFGGGLTTLLLLWALLWSAWLIAKTRRESGRTG